MSIQELNAAVGLIDDRYLDIADRAEKRNVRRAARRVAAVLVAVLVLLFACTVVAFAANEGFREAVLHFLHISAADHVQHEPVESLPISTASPEETDNGESVTVTRVSVPNFGHAANGLFAVCADEIEYNQGSRYDIYEQRGGELVLLERRVFEQDYLHNGVSYHFCIEWATNGEKAALGYVRTEKTDTSAENYHVWQQTAGNPAKLLVFLDEPDGWYPLTVDLASGEVREIAPDYPWEELSFITNAEISPDGTLLLVRAGKFYCAHIASGKVSCMDELCGAALLGCGFAENGKVSCWALTGGEANEEALALYAQGKAMYEKCDFGTLTAWSADLTQGSVLPVVDGEAATVLTNVGALWHGTERTEAVSPGIVYVQGCYMLLVDEMRNMVVIDLTDGSRSRIDAALWPETKWPYIGVVGSPDGEKLLIREREPEHGRLFRLSVLDFGKRRYITIDRDASQVGNERYADWFDKDTVMVDNDVVDAAGCSTGERWYYLYHVG